MSSHTRRLIVLLAVVAAVGLLAVGAAQGATAVDAEQSQSSVDAPADSFESITDAAQDDENVTVAIESVAGAAGGTDSPGTISVLVSLEDDDQPISSGDVSADDFNVSVGPETVGSENITSVTELQPGEHLVTFPAPEQDEPGTYNLTVEFQDTEEVVENVIIYSAADAQTIAANMQIDASGSMSGILGEAQDGATRFVEEASDDDYVSVVSYSSSADLEQSLVQLGDGRQDVLTAINGLSAGGGTNIGDAIDLGLDTLDDAPNGTVQAGIHLTDGIRNRGPSKDEIINEIVPQYNEQNVCLYTIGFTDAADVEFMQNVTDAADCGFYRFAAEEGETDEAEETLLEVFADMREDIADEEEFEDESGTVPANGTTESSYNVDDSVTQKSTNIQFEGVEFDPESDQLVVQDTSVDELTLFGPDGNVVDDTQDNVNVSVFSNSVVYRVDNPQPGEWTYELENPTEDETDYSTSVTGSSQVSLDAFTDADSYLINSTVSLTASLSGQEGAVTSATATATIEAPDESTTNITLSHQGDGVYSGDVELTQPGEYEATISAEDGDLTRNEDVSWSVVDEAPLSVEQETDVTVEQDGEGTFELSLDRPTEAEGEVDVVIGAGDVVRGNESFSGEHISFDQQTFDVAPGDELTTSVTVEPPFDAELGAWTGEAFVYVDGEFRFSSEFDLTVEPTTAYTAGDVLGTGDVTINDAVAIQYDSLNLEPPFDTYNSVLADTNRNGEVIISDAVLAQRISLGLEDEEELDITSFNAPDEATIGETIEVNATVVNDGDLGALERATHSIEGDVTAAETLDVGGVDTDSNEVDISMEIDTSGLDAGMATHSLSVGDETASADIELVDD